MITLIQIFTLIGLLIFSILAMKNMKIPSMFTNGFILALLVYYGVAGLLAGLFTFVFAYFLSESVYDLGGIADVKLLTAFGITIPFGWTLITFLVIFMFLGIVWKYLAKKILKLKKEVPFIPVILFTYISYLSFKLFILVG